MAISLVHKIQQQLARLAHLAMHLYKLEFSPMLTQPKPLFSQLQDLTPPKFTQSAIPPLVRQAIMTLEFA
jgi:hypothetical protein